MYKIKKVNIKNVVAANNIITDEYPFGWDCKALANSLEVIYLDDNGDFKREVYMVDERFGYDLPHTEVELEWVNNYEEMQIQYQKHLLQQRCEESKKVGHSFWAKIGDTVEVYKGRKFPKGTQFKIKGETTWKDMYGRTQVWYWVTECGKRVDKCNCIIVG